MGLFGKKTKPETVQPVTATPIDLGPDPVSLGFEPKTRWQKSRLLESYGTSKYQHQLAAAHEAAKTHKGFVVARLQHVPTSPDGPTTVAIIIGGATVGYVAKNQARNLAPRLAKVGGQFDVLASINGGKMYTVTAWLPNGKP